jgi:hypothetical protein
MLELPRRSRAKSAPKPSKQTQASEAHPVAARPAAQRKAGRATQTALTIGTDSDRVGCRGAGVLTAAAIARIRAGIDTSAAATNERALTLKIAAATVAHGRGVRGRHAHGAASAAVGGVTAGVDARRPASRLAATVGFAGAGTADRAGAADLRAAAAVFRVGRLVDALTAARAVPGVAAEPAGSPAATRAAVRGLRAGVAAAAAVLTI